MNNLCPITGKVCQSSKCYHVVDIEKKEIKCFDICFDCLDNIDCAKKIQADCCEFCGMTIEELLKKSRMGCAHCYNKFEQPLLFSLEKLQRLPKKETNQPIKHVGHVPYLWKMQQAENTPPDKFILELKQKLAICVKYEDYKRAQDLKNKIRVFEFFIKKIDEFNHDEEQCELIKKQMAEFIYNFREEEKELEKH
jgi:protein-arginine kinase activator protein McsA